MDNESKVDQTQEDENQNTNTTEKQTNDTEVAATKEQSSGGSGSSTSLEPNIAGLLCYLVWPITSIIFLIIEKENRFVRYHAWQSLMTSASIIVIYIVVTIVLTVLAFIPWVGLLFGLLGTLFYLLASIGTFVLWIYLMIQAYNNKEPKLPFVGNFSENQVNKQ